MNDFDFLFGRWDVSNRRLEKRLVGSTDWRQFPATSECRSLFGGAANVDEIVFPTEGFSGVTLRLFDPRRGQWSLHWASSDSGVLFPPVVGGFTDGRGEFHGDDSEGGTPVRIRFLWTRMSRASARWEQAFSVDGARTWETNWIMDLSRAS